MIKRAISIQDNVKELSFVNIAINIGAIIAEVSDATEEYLNMNAVISHIPIKIRATGHDSARYTPMAVATPLPPWN